MKTADLSLITKSTLIVFDLGNVVLDIDFRRICAYWAYRTNLEVVEVARRYKIDEAYEQHERGELSGEEYYEHVKTNFNLDLSWEAFEHGWNLIFKPENGLTSDLFAEFVQQKRSAILSNTNALHIGHALDRYHDYFSPLERLHFSFELGARKPESEIFTKVQEVESLDPSAMLLIDDSEENLKAAASAGWQTLHVRQSSDVSNLLTAWLKCAQAT